MCIYIYIYIYSIRLHLIITSQFRGGLRRREVRPEAARAEDHEDVLQAYD